MKIFALFFFIIGCAGLKDEPREGKTSYSYADVSGSYKLVREFKKVKNKLVTRNQLLTSKGGNNRVLEKTVLVSQIGSIKSKKSRLIVLRPFASEFTVWLEGKKYSNRIKLNSKNRSFELTLDSPDPKWQGKTEVRFPGGKYFCFFNQIPECLYHNYLLIKALEKKNQKLDFFIVWDGYPFIQDQLTRAGQSLFAPASLKFDGEIKGQIRYIVEVEGQMILYHFTKAFDLVKMSWITQGITVVPPGQEVADDE